MFNTSRISEYRIAIVINDIALEKGGAERVVITLAEHLKPIVKRIDVIVFDNRQPKYTFPINIINLDCPPRKSFIGKVINVLYRTVKLKQQYKKNSYTHVFSFMESSNFPTILSCPEKAIVSVRSNPDKFDAITQKIMKLLYKRAYAVVSVSQAIEVCLVEKYYLSNTRHIPNPLNINYIQELANASFKKPPKYLLAVGRLTRPKGFDLLIKAYANSRLSRSIELIILGEGEEREALQTLVSTLALEGRVHLPGETSNPYQYMKNTELFILSSRYEGYPNVLIEALACHCPIVATNCPTGPNEIIIDGINGILVENENIGQLANAMDSLINNPGLREKFRKNTANTISHLDVNKIAKKWLEI